MRQPIAYLSLACLVAFSSLIFTACDDDNTLPTVDENKITRPYYMQFDLIDEKSGDSTRITRQYSFLPSFGLDIIDSNHTQTQLLINNATQYESISDAESPGKRVFVNFFNTFATPYDSLRKLYRSHFRDSLGLLFKIGSYTYSIRDTSFGSYSDGIEIRCDDHSSAGGTNRTRVDNSKSSFSITNIQPLDTTKDGFMYHISGTFNCKTVDGKGKTYQLKNGKFSSIVIKTIQPL